MFGRLKTLGIAAACCAGAAAIGIATATPTAAVAASLRSGAPAPEFAGIAAWLNSDPLTARQLKGRVLLVDFWTASCINCIHTLPFVTQWDRKYREQGLTVVGVHTPEFESERDMAIVQAAIRRYGITYPVALDNQYRTWNAYGNQYWPAFYLIDRRGRVVYTHVGEGDYAQTEAAIQAALAQK
ncbi:MAG TPA: thioredoxin family protein [Paraburkholderia sp.]|nr:thioredoxin family protein [Paraburkholderia sp.]